MISLLISAYKCNRDAPLAPKNIKLYIGDHEIQAICRLNDNDEIECIASNELDFEGFQCMSIEDHEKVLNYIIELNDRCLRWKK